jgi:hypothetical protein
MGKVHCYMGSFYNDFPLFLANKDREDFRMTHWLFRMPSDYC